MAIVKLYFRKNADNVIHYVFEHTQPGDRADSENCPPYAQGACEEFEAVRNQHHYKGGRNQVIHIIQSWDEEDSKKLTPKQINEMGRSLVGDYFKGHQFVIVTHTETGKFHNHIAVNTIHMETGRHVENKKHHLHRLRAINDKICLERGLKIPYQDAVVRNANIPQKVRQMVRAGKESWVWDIRNKADVARNLATSHEEYVSYMGALGVKARVENENITYFYPGRSRGKRGSKMGKVYDKPGLEEQFKLNDERFQKMPEVRQKIWHQYQHLTQEGTHTLFAQKDYQTFTKTARNQTRSFTTAQSELKRGILPIEEIHRARRSIVDYCKEHKIPLTQNSKGQTVLKDKDYILIDGDRAKNTKNGTHATLIDFVAAQHNLTLLQAVAKINNNPSLLAFEQNFGEIKRKFTSFYIPKPDQMPHQEASQHLIRFLKSHGIKGEVAESLFQKQRAEVSKSGMIRLFADMDSEGALEFTPERDGSWKQTKRGSFKKPFFNRAPTGNRATLFMDPNSFMSGRGSD